MTPGSFPVSPNFDNVAWLSCASRHEHSWAGRLVQQTWAFWSEILHWTAMFLPCSSYYSTIFVPTSTATAIATTIYYLYILLIYIYIYMLQTELLGKNVKLFAENASRNFSTVFGAIFTDWTLCPPSNQGDRILLEEHNSSKIYTVQKTLDKKQKDTKGRVCKLSYRFTYLHINYQIHDLYVSFHHLLLLFICYYIFWLLYVERLPVMKMYKFLYRERHLFHISPQKKTATTQLPAGSTFWRLKLVTWQITVSIWRTASYFTRRVPVCRSGFADFEPPYAPCIVYLPWTLW